MSYAAPFYYAAKAVQSHERSPHQPHELKQRRRRIRLVLFPAQRVRRSQPQVATASSDF